MAFVTIKKKTVIVVLSLIIAVVSAFAVGATVIASARADNGITIVIDAGHGGADGGVVGKTTGTKESDINLSISKYLGKYLENAGYNVVMTRSDSAAVSGGVKYSKRDDMRARRDILSSAAPDLVISVHCNSYPVSTVSGAQTFFATDPKGEFFANKVQSYFNDVLNDKPRSAAVGDYYILKCSEYPSILCECGFLSNSVEENKLITASYQEKVAYTIFSAVDAVFMDDSRS
ncbi:MAG: N-acetylmuramoyl-L-alanine amidase [Clostridiales bacterium]|nr:N-acetylmuramoyl-L-alanine amidase [Clostridiales bacterium]